MDSSSSSKVTVEYHDLSGIFPLVSRDIAARLPLRNLNWQTPARPLRQIKALHLEFVPDQVTRDSTRPVSQLSESSTPNGTGSSLDLTQTGTDPKKVLIKERRHQIPGLQTSPYLKIYVLRCDDKDTYKATERKKLRDWIRDEAAAVTAKAKHKGKGEEHDAFEWMILHVVVPDTVAASESRWRVSQKDADELKERKQAGKWPGKSTRTVFDKLRADFNETGKTVHDRVAQIRLLKNQIPADLLPDPPVATTLEETAEEREKAWHDLMTKLKNLILEPFDRRVKQYETDIAEQEVRRSLPGFNFCTFFIHKEGLAIALESIGLVEDALVIYDELALGLDTILRDISNGQAEGTATIFAPYTDDIVDRITASHARGVNGVESNAALEEEWTGLFLQDYRRKIVTSTISVFDFLCYLFTRQRALILRLANAKSARAELGSTTRDGGEDLVLLSEVCWRASAFISNGARMLRQDLRAHKTYSAGWNTSEQDIEALVCSWTYVLAGKILDDTNFSALDPQDPGRPENVPPSTLHRSELTFAGLGANQYPQRTTSLTLKGNRVNELQSNKSFIKSASESDITSQSSVSAADGTISINPKLGSVPGVPELATYRAELVMLRRKTLEQVAQQRNWVAGWNGLRRDREHSFKDVDLDDHADTALSASSKEPAEELLPSVKLAPALTSAMKSREDYYNAYEKLSNIAIQYYITATQTKTVETIMGDLAVLKAQQGEYEYADKYFQHVLPINANDGWDLSEAEALLLHSDCLKALGRNEEYIETLLALLAKACQKERHRLQRFTKLMNLDEEDVPIEGMLRDIVDASVKLPGTLTTQADKLFSNINLDTVLLRRYHERTDGFSLHFSIRHLLSEPFHFDAVSARLIHEDDSSLEIVLTTRQAGSLIFGMNGFDLQTNTVAFGLFRLDSIELRAGKIKVAQQFQSADGTEEQIYGAHFASPGALSGKVPEILAFPANDAFCAEIDLDRHVQVGKQRGLEVSLHSGWNDIQRMELRLKPASAGLRLHLPSATAQQIELSNGDESAPGHLQLGALPPHQNARIHVPFSLELSPHDISIRLEATYHASDGSFKFIHIFNLPTTLYVDVVVNDTFHYDALFSVFTVKTVGDTPLCVTGANLKSSVLYDTESPPPMTSSTPVLKQHPIKLMFKTTKKAVLPASFTKRDAALELQVSFHPLTNILAKVLCEKFAQSIEQSEFLDLRRLMVHMMTARFASLCTIAELEKAALFHEMSIPSYDSIGWPAATSTLSPDLGARLDTWLRLWHDQHPSIQFSDTVFSDSPSRCISIAVDVPTVEFVHRTSLSLSKDRHRGDANLPILSLGHPITTQLTVSSTRRWSSAANKKLDESSRQSEEATDFLFDIHAESDTWLIGGQRRARFTAVESPELSFEVTLLPLQLGILSLPTIDVQPAAGSPMSPGDKGPVTSETHCESAGQVVQIIRDIRRTRVEIPDLVQ